MTTKLLIGGHVQELKASKAVHMPGWQQLLDQLEEERATGGLYSQSVWANRCIDIRAHLLSAIPWEIVVRGDDQADPLREDHPLVHLLSDVNPESDWITHSRATESDLCWNGKAYWLKVGGSETKPDWLMRLNPATMKVIASEKGIEAFEQQLKSGAPKRYDRQQVIFFHEYDPANDFGGVAKANVCKAAIRTEAACNAYLADFFENYAMPGVILESEQEIDRSVGMQIVDQFRQRFGGKKNRSKVGLMDKGLKAHVITHPVKDLALEDIRAEARRDICAAFGVPPAVAGAWEAANYATSQEQRKSIYQETLFARAIYLAGVINAELVWKFDPRLGFRFRFEDVEAMQESEDAHSTRIVQQFQAKIISRETAVTELGYDIDAAYEPEPVPQQLQDAQREQQGPSGDEQADLAKWQRKAIFRLAKSGKAACEFVSNHIPAQMVEAIKGSLEGCASEEDVRAVFRNATNWEGYPVPTSLRVGYKAPDIAEIVGAAVKAAMENMARPAAPLEFKVNSMTVEQKPEIHVAAPQVTNEVKVPDVIVAVEAPDVQVAAPVVNVSPDIKLHQEAKAEKEPVRLRQRHQHQRIERDGRGNMEQTVTDVEYVYDDEL